ncbi:DUF2304 domain-containing protein [Mucilaginibacter sp.]
MLRIQIITIIASLAFLYLVFRMVVKGRLREEYSIIWLLFTGILVVFSFWEKGLLLVTDLFGIYLPANLVFTISIFIALVYLLHLSVVASKLQKQNKLLAQEMAIMKNEMEKLKEENTK